AAAAADVDCLYLHGAVPVLIPFDQVVVGGGVVRRDPDAEVGMAADNVAGTGRRPADRVVVRTVPDHHPGMSPECGRAGRVRADEVPQDRRLNPSPVQNAYAA